MLWLPPVRLLQLQQVAIYRLSYLDQRFDFRSWPLHIDREVARGNQGSWYEERTK